MWSLISVGPGGRFRRECGGHDIFVVIVEDRGNAVVRVGDLAPVRPHDLIGGAAKQDRVGSGEPIGVENAAPTGRRTASASLPAPAGMGCRIPQVPRALHGSVQADEGVDGELYGVPSPCGFDRDLLRDAVT